MTLIKWLSGFFKRGPSPLDNFTPRMQQVLKLARKAADDHCHRYVGTEHLLLGILVLGEGVGFCALCRLGVDLPRLREDLERSMTVGAKQKRLSMIPYTPVVKRVLLKYGYREARELGNGYFGTEHLLLGLLSGKAGLAFKALENQAVELLAARKAVQDCVAPEPAATAEPNTQAEKIESGPQAKTDPIKIHPIRLPDFKFREPDDRGDVKMLADIRGHGWHVVFVPADEHGPGFAFTVGLYLRTLQPEILIMGVDQAPSGRVLNAIGEFLMAGGELVPERRYPHFVDGREVIFRRIAASNYRDYLGCANWFYRTWPAGFPAMQCIWPDLKGVLPHEPDFEEKFRVHQIDLSVEKSS